VYCEYYWTLLLHSVLAAVESLSVSVLHHVDTAKHISELFYAEKLVISSSKKRLTLVAFMYRNTFE